MQEIVPLSTDAREALVDITREVEMLVSRSGVRTSESGSGWAFWNHTGYQWSSWTVPLAEYFLL